jgi:hypothetical protein
MVAQAVRRRQHQVSVAGRIPPAFVKQRSAVRWNLRNAPGRLILLGATVTISARRGAAVEAADAAALTMLIRRAAAIAEIAGALSARPAA